MFPHVCIYLLYDLRTTDLETAKSTPPPTTSSPASVASQEAPAKEEDSEGNTKETDNSVNLDDEQYQNTEEDTNEPTE